MVDETQASELGVYEVAVHFIPTLSEEDVAKEFANLKSSIDKIGGVFVSEQAPRTMHLAYTFAKKENSKNTKYDSAYFCWVKYEGTGEHAESVKEIVEANKNVLRYLLVKTIRETIIRGGEKPAPAADAKPRKTLREDPSKEAERGEVSEAELDKTIDELVAAK